MNIMYGCLHVRKLTANQNALQTKMFYIKLITLDIN